MIDLTHFLIPLSPAMGMISVETVKLFSPFTLFLCISPRVPLLFPLFIPKIVTIFIENKRTDEILSKEYFSAFSEEFYSLLISVLFFCDGKADYRGGFFFVRWHGRLARGVIEASLFKLFFCNFIGQF